MKKKPRIDGQICHGCKCFFEADDIVWINSASTGDGSVPYCVKCCPSQW